MGPRPRARNRRGASAADTGRRPGHGPSTRSTGGLSRHTAQARRGRLTGWSTTTGERSRSSAVNQSAPIRAGPPAVAVRTAGARASAATSPPSYSCPSGSYAVSGDATGRCLTDGRGTVAQEPGDEEVVVVPGLLAVGGGGPAGRGDPAVGLDRHVVEIVVRVVGAERVHREPAGAERRVRAAVRVQPNDERVLDSVGVLGGADGDDLPVRLAGDRGHGLAARRPRTTAPPSPKAASGWPSACRRATAISAAG